MDKVSVILERKKRSIDYWAPIYEEFVEVERAVKCRTTPIYKTDKAGNRVEDTSRTNVCMPGLSIMVRKNTARLTAQAPKINYVSTKSPDAAEKLSAWATWQYDITDEAKVQRKHVMQAEQFGISVTKLYQDNVVLRRNFRVQTQNATRRQLMLAQGQDVSDMEGDGEPLSPEEQSAALAEYGPEFSYEEELQKYSGPCVKFVFIGDIHFPPGCESLESAEWVIEDLIWTTTDLEYWAEQTYVDPETGETMPVLDEKAVQQMIEEDSEMPRDDKTTLRQRFRAIMKLDPLEKELYPKSLYAGKKFKVLECHERDEKGRIWIYWVGQDKAQIGKMPLPWDLYGKHAYTELVPLPDLTTVVGDSTPRLGRFLHRLHNAAVGQRTDLVTNFMRPLVFERIGADIAEEATERSLFKSVTVKNLNDVQVERLPGVPPEAWESENAILRQMGMLEPSILAPDLAGTNANPMSGKTATTAVLAQRAQDALLQFKIDGLNIYFKEVQQKKLWILQQTLQSTIQVPGSYVSDASLQKLAPEALSMRSGSARVIHVDPFEIQEDFGVEPEAGSTLSQEDEFHRMSAQQFFQLAQSAPDIFDVRYAAQNYAATIKGVDVNKAVLPPPPPQPPLPKVQGNLNFPMEKIASIAPDVFNELLQMFGMKPSEDVKHNALLDGIVKMGDAANAAGKLAEPAGAAHGAGADTTTGLRKTAAGELGASAAGV